MIGYFADYYSAGIYRIAKKLVDPINSLIVAFSPWMLNKINNQGDYNFRNLFINILLPSSVIIVSFYYLFGSNLIEIIAGDEFADAFLPMMILLFGFMSYYLTFWTRHFLFMNDLIHKHGTNNIAMHKSSQMEEKEATVRASMIYEEMRKRKHTPATPRANPSHRP